MLSLSAAAEDRILLPVSLMSSLAPDPAVHMHAKSEQAESSQHLLVRPILASPNG